jgi:phosphatidylinositol alpha-mannosyltransferase
VRIGIVCPYSLSLPGGVQGQVLGLARALRGKGHEVRVLAPCDGPPPDAGVTPLGASIPTAANGSVAPIAPDVPAQLRTIRALRDEAFDVVHLHEPMAPGPTQTAVLFKVAPLVGTFHAAGGSAAYRAFGPLVRRAARRLDVRCAVSEDARAMARQALGGDYELVFNGVEVAHFRDAEPTPTTGPTVLFLGRHEPRKGLATLLGALAELPEELRLWVAGDGPETEELTRRHGDDPRIEWLGRISEEEKLARLRGADVFCAPSLRGESFGIVLLEAMAACTPVVASDLPGYANVARAGRDALLVPPGDPSALASAVARVLDERELAAGLVASGLERAAEFSMDHLADRYLELYATAIEREAARPVA